MSPNLVLPNPSSNYTAAEVVTSEQFVVVVEISMVKIPLQACFLKLKKAHIVPKHQMGKALEWDFINRLSLFQTIRATLSSTTLFIYFLCSIKSKAFIFQLTIIIVNCFIEISNVVDDPL